MINKVEIIQASINVKKTIKINKLESDIKAKVRIMMNLKNILILKEILKKSLQKF